MSELICKNCRHGKDCHVDKWGGICVGCPCPGFEPIEPIRGETVIFSPGAVMGGEFLDVKEPKE